MLGSTRVSLEGLTGIARKVKVYVVGFDNKRYDLIVGCDVLGSVSGSLEKSGKGWRVKLGWKRYEIRGRAYPGEEIVTRTVILRKEDRTQVEWVKREFSYVFNGFNSLTGCLPQSFIKKGKY